MNLILGGEEFGHLWYMTDQSHCSHWYETLLVLKLGPQSQEPSLCPQAHKLLVSSTGAVDIFSLDSSSHVCVNLVIGSAYFSWLNQLGVIEFVHLS